MFYIASHSSLVIIISKLYKEEVDMQDPNQTPPEQYPQQPQPQVDPQFGQAPAPQPYTQNPAPEFQAAQPQQFTQQPPIQQDSFAQPVQPQAQPYQQPQQFGAAPQPEQSNPFFANQPQPDATFAQQSQPQQFQTYNPAAPAGPPSPNKRSKKPFIIIGIIVAVLLIAAAATFFILNQGSPKGISAGQADSSETNGDTTAPSEKESIAVTNVNEFSALCENKKASNAAAPDKPYKPIVFLKTAGTWALFVGSDPRLSIDQAAINVATCISVDESTEKLVQANCEATNISTRAKVKVEAYSVEYKVTFYAAATGEIIASSTITPASQSCPLYANEPGKYYILPTDSDLKPALDTLFAA